MNTPSKTVNSERERIFSPPSVGDVLPVEQRPEYRRNQKEYQKKEEKVLGWLKKYVREIVRPTDVKKYESLMAPYKGPHPDYEALSQWVYQTATIDNCPIDELESILADLETAKSKRKRNMDMLGDSVDEGHRQWYEVLEMIHTNLHGASYHIEIEGYRRDNERRAALASSESSNTAVDASATQSNPSSTGSDHAQDDHEKELQSDNEFEREGQTNKDVDSEQEDDEKREQENLEKRTLVGYDLNQADLEGRTLVDEDDADGLNRTDIQEVGGTEYEEPKEHDDNQSDEGQDQQEEPEEDKEQKERESAKKKAESQRKHKQEKAKKARRRKEAAAEAAKQKVKKVLRSIAIGVLLFAAYILIIYGMIAGRY